MPRNLDQRVETVFPVLDPRLQAEVREMLEVQLTDTVNARLFQRDGTSVRVGPTDGVSVRLQERLHELIGTRRE